MIKRTLLFSFISFTTLVSVAAETVDLDTIAEGGRLYDKWWKELNLNKPTSPHISYPATSKKQSGSWRCKECHGWDYEGAAGAYGKNSHYTGIIGVTAAKNKSINEIITILKNKTHNYNGLIANAELIKLANFIKYGQVTITKYLNPKTKRANGAFKKGKRTYISSCKKCHSSDGRGINFRTPKEPEYIGTVAQYNPWEAVHKIRNGQPYTKMPNMNSKLNIEAQIDLLTYLQSLPAK